MCCLQLSLTTCRIVIKLNGMLNYHMKMCILEGIYVGTKIVDMMTVDTLGFFQILKLARPRKVGHQDLGQLGKKYCVRQIIQQICSRILLLCCQLKYILNYVWSLMFYEWQQMVCQKCIIRHK